MSGIYPGFCHTCDTSVNLTQRPVRGQTHQVGQTVQMEFICPLCRTEFVELDEAQQQENTRQASRVRQQQRSMLSPFNPLMSMLFGGPLGLGGPGGGLGGGLFDSLFSDDNDPDSEEGFNNILRLIEERERNGQSPADLEAVARLPKFTYDDKWIAKQKKELFDKYKENQQLAQEERKLKRLLSSTTMDDSVPNQIERTKPSATEDGSKLDMSDWTDAEILQQVDYDFERTVPECKICLCQPDDADEMITLPCCHVYHMACFEGWCKGHNTCPICRVPLPLAKPAGPMSAVRQLPNGTTVRISTHSIPAVAPPQQTRVVQSGLDSAVARANREAASSQNNSPTSTTTTTASNAVVSRSNNNNLPAITTTPQPPAMREQNGVRYIERPDGSTVMIDSTGIRIRDPDGTVRLIGTTHSLNAGTSTNTTNTPSTPAADTTTTTTQTNETTTQPDENNNTTTTKTTTTITTTNSPINNSTTTNTTTTTTTTTADLVLNTSTPPITTTTTATSTTNLLSQSLTSPTPITTPSSATPQLNLTKTGGAYGKKFLRPAAKTPTVATPAVTTPSTAQQQQ